MPTRPIRPPLRRHAGICMRSAKTAFAARRWAPTNSGRASTSPRRTAAQVADPQLRAKLTPDYELGCKRILRSDDFYPR